MRESSCNLDAFSETNKKLAKRIEEEEEEEEDTAISVRSFERSDVDGFMSWVQCPVIYRFSNEPTPCNEEDCTTLLRAQMSHPWFKSIRVDQKSIGAVSVTWVGACKAEIGYAVGPAHWGRGIATRAVRIAASDAFWQYWPSLKRIEAIVDVDNGASMRVLEKVGFKREGVLRQYYVLKGNRRDMVMYSLLSSDPL